jgi:son of sevenless-like protein
MFHDVDIITSACSQTVIQTSSLYSLLAAKLARISLSSIIDEYGMRSCTQLTIIVFGLDEETQQTVTIDMHSINENQIVLREDGTLHSASLDGIVVWLTQPERDYNNELEKAQLQAILLCHSNFTNKQTLFVKLAQRFEQPQENQIENIYKIRKIVVKVIFTWSSEMFRQDWNDLLTCSLIRDMLFFMIRHTGTEDAYNLWRNGLNRVIDCSPDLLEETEKKTGLFTHIVQSFKRTAPTVQPTHLNDLDALTIAQQLTVQATKMYRALSTSDMLMFHNPMPIDLTHRFNNIVNWISDQVLVHKTLKERAKFLEKTIDIADQLWKLNNFMDCFCIMSGLNDAGVHRLRYTWDRISNARRNRFDELNVECSNDRSYQNVRRAMKQCLDIDQPCVPLLFIFITDLVFIANGNHAYVEQDMVNIRKLELVFAVVNDLMRARNNKYSLTEIKLVQGFIENALQVNAFQNEQERFMESLKLEPRNSNKKDII